MLVSVGKENLYLSSQPEITFYKTVYKKYTNFSTELIAQYFKTIGDFGRKVTVNLSKMADLVGKIYLYIELPNIESSNHSNLPDGIKKFSWVKKPGLSIIKYIDLEIGGVLVSRQYGDWLNIIGEINQPFGKKRGYDKMIGNIPELINFSNGKENTYGIYIPLDFWFCKDSGLALPLVSLTHHEIKIHVEFNNFEDCYKESPNHYLTIDSPICLFDEGEQIIQEVDGNIYIGEFVYFDIINKRIYYNKIKGDFQIPTYKNLLYKLKGKKSLFETNIEPNSKIVVDETYFMNPKSIKKTYLLVNYIYLDNKERWFFINKNHEYLVPIVQNISSHTLYNINSSYKIPLVNPSKIIFWRAILLSNQIRNDNFNYTLNPLTETYDNIIEKHQIIINSIPRLDIDNWEHYSYLQNYQSKFNSPQKGLYSYSFCLNPNSYQPSGSLNFSKIDDAYLQLTMNKLINYQNPITIKLYGIQYNLFRVIDGLGGLAYYL